MHEAHIAAFVEEFHKKIRVRCYQEDKDKIITITYGEEYKNTDYNLLFTEFATAMGHYDAVLPNTNKQIAAEPLHGQNKRWTELEEWDQMHLKFVPKNTMDTGGSENNKYRDQTELKMSDKVPQDSPCEVEKLSGQIERSLSVTLQCS